MSFVYAGSADEEYCKRNEDRGTGIAMKVYTYSQARQKLSEVLETARNENVIIRRRGGESFTVSYRPDNSSPLDVPGIDTDVTTKDILTTIRESRRISRSSR
jgi:hypothetical protein